MPVAPLPFVNQQSSGLSELAGGAPVANNVVYEQGGAVRRRPGIAASKDAVASVVDANGLDGLFATQRGHLYAVGSKPGVRKFYRVTAAGVVQLSESTNSETFLQGTERPVFAETEALLVVTAGEQPSKIALDTHAIARLGGSPPKATHVLANAARLLLNDASGVFPGIIYFSGQALGSSITNHEHWVTSGLARQSTEGFFQAEARPDPVVALAENTNEIFAFGRSSLQVFVPDSFSVYAPAGQREFGCAAAYSIVKIDNSFVWLDQYRRFVVSDGRSVEVVSDPIQQTLNNMSRVNDCFGYRVVTGPTDCVVFTFPTDGRTFCFQKGSGWSQWTSGTGFGQLDIRCFHFRDATNENLVGTSDGKIGALTHATQQDLGSSFQASVTTGYINRDTDMRKQCTAVRLALKRGSTATTLEPQGWLTWRERPGPWLGRAPVRFGTAGQSEIVVSLRSLGMYRRRQWSFEFSGPEEFVLAGAEEEFEILGD